MRLQAPLAVVEARAAGRARGQHLSNAREHLHAGADAADDLRLEVATATPAEVARAALPS
ncbi:hypothetical protein GCM10009714_35440 [Microlunatus capsulatus]